MKMMNKNLRAIAALLIACVATSASAKSTVNLTGRESSGFNALDHVLQKPLGNDTFPAGDRAFGNHIFLGVGAGVSAIGNEFDRVGIKPGLRLGGQIGGWITPVHGVRVSGDLGVLSVHNDVSRVWFGAVRADYLLNFTSLLRGYDPSRRFEMVGAVGLEYQRLRQRHGLWGNDVGIGAALQMRFNVAPSLFLFVEPRLAMMTGRRYDGVHDWRRMKADMSLNIGLGYRVLRGRARAAGSTRFVQSKDDNLFFGVEAGLWDMMRPNFPRHMFEERSWFGAAFAGKMFSSTSGLQGVLNFGEFTSTGGKFSRFSIGSLDYVLNVGNAFGGYRPRQVFQLLFNVGVSGAMVNNSSGTHLYPGVDAGLTGLFRVSPNWGVFLHPQMHLFGRDFARRINSLHAPLASLAVGVRYTIGDYTRTFTDDYATYAPDKHYFLNFAGGVTHRLRAGYGQGMDFNIGFGKRFTPVSSWRVSLDGNADPQSPHYVALALQADYLASITTSMYGYNPNRVFDLQLVVGLFGGAANYDRDIRATYGIKGGFQAGFRLNSALDLVIEPQFLAMSAPDVRSSRKWIPELRGLVGLRYKLGTPEGGRGRIADAPYGDARTFLSIAGGPSMFSGTATRKNPKVTGTFDVSLGRWFSLVSGFRLTYGSDWVERSGATRYVGSAHLDYLLNFTSLFDRSAERRFHVIGAVGGGLAFCHDSKSAFGAMTYGGVQFRYNLPHNIDIHIEPGAEFWGNRVLPDPVGSHRFVMNGRVTAGLSFRF